MAISKANAQRPIDIVSHKRSFQFQTVSTQYQKCRLLTILINTVDDLN